MPICYTTLTQASIERGDQAFSRAHRLPNQLQDAGGVGGLHAQIQDQTLPPTLHRQTHRRDQPEETLPTARHQPQKGEAGEVHAWPLAAGVQN